MSRKSEYVVAFKDVGKEDVALVGGKGANLGEMTRAGFPVPNGFIVTAKAYYHFIHENNLTVKIKHLLETVNYNHQDSLTQVSKHIQKVIIESPMSPELQKEILTAYKALGGIFKDALVAVRSSATAEDLPTASFAGQQETYLNVKGDANVLLKIKAAWASLFNARAIFYRHEQKFDDFKIGIAIPVQKMVESQQSGIMFTIDPLTNDKTKVVIEAILGLGELIVQGAVTPDHYEVDKNSMEISHKIVSIQDKMMKKAGVDNKIVSLSKSEGEKQKITTKEILELAELGKKLEKHYYFPQDSEWAIEKSKVYIVQTRPITTIAATDAKNKEDAKTPDTNKYELLTKGAPASPGIASGPVRILHSASEVGKILQGEVLVASQTNPDYVPAMKKAVAIVTDHGGRTSHAAIVSRELGIPAVVGTENATKILKTGQIITVNGMKGEIYKGGHIQVKQAEVTKTNVTKTATKVYVNLAQPDLAEKVAQQHVDGVGLLRAEFIMADIGTHPKKLLKEHKRDVFVKKMAEQLGVFAKAFNPRPVIYRTSDFKTNEYRALIGGKEFEPEESNPMLGYRGAYRYMHDPAVFEMELDAIKIVRNKMGLKNLWVMIPFVRTVKELIEVKKVMAAAGLHRTASFKLFMMVEIPSNVILLDEFINVGIDGVSIGSNDLTMLILGTDRDNSEVATEFDEQNPAVLWALEHVIKTAHKHNIMAGICGQAPSVYPELVEKLVKWGITSISVSPDAIDAVRENIAQTERKLLGKK
ncbi:MAG: phosphoenolpyruvate synthase [Candidatus Levybacteria bacterium]|nr:phosphoenolpyruvate synthase [Candidatus Levybacteria bacterium]